MQGFRYLEDAITLTLDAEKCTGCRECATVCPHGVFAMVDKRATIADRKLAGAEDSMSLRYAADSSRTCCTTDVSKAGSSLVMIYRSSSSASKSMRSGWLSFVPSV